MGYTILLHNLWVTQFRYTIFELHNFRVTQFRYTISLHNFRVTQFFTQFLKLCNSLFLSAASKVLNETFLNLQQKICIKHKIVSMFSIFANAAIVCNCMKLNSVKLQFRANACNCSNPVAFTCKFEFASKNLYQSNIVSILFVSMS